jgi:hypothetical protein
MKEHLATRKALDRAEGVLMQRSGMDVSLARFLILRQVVQSGLSPREVAKQIIEAERLCRETEASSRANVNGGCRTSRRQIAAKAPWQSVYHSSYAKRYSPGMQSVQPPV